MRIAIISLIIALAPVALGVACATEKHACDTKPDCKTCPAPGAPMHHADGAMACAPMGDASPTAVPKGVNAVQNEMRLLNHAFHMSMTAAALGDVSVIPGLFHPVHQARGLTDKAVESGAWQPAKGDMAAFKTMDATFHADLEKLMQAAQANDSAAVVDQLDHLLPSCLACHSSFREPGLPAGMKPATPPAEHPEHPKP